MCVCVCVWICLDEIHYRFFSNSTFKNDGLVFEFRLNQNQSINRLVMANDQCFVWHILKIILFFSNHHFTESIKNYPFVAQLPICNTMLHKKNVLLCDWLSQFPIVNWQIIILYYFSQMMTFIEHNIIAFCLSAHIAHQFRWLL